MPKNCISHQNWIIRLRDVDDEKNQNRTPIIDNRHFQTEHRFTTSIHKMIIDIINQNSFTMTPSAISIHCTKIDRVLK